MQPISTQSVLHHSLGKRLDLVEDVFHLSKHNELKELVIVGAQHILPSTLSMLQSFFDRGLSPGNVFLIGKCYSTDFQTYCQLKDLGVFVCPSSLEFDPSSSFDSFYASNIKLFANQFMSLLTRLGKMKTVVLDDGGELISQLNTINNDEIQMSCLEQTTSGYEKLKRLDLKMGVVNVARSHAKLKIESGIVAKTAVQAIYEKLFYTTLSPKNILIFGNGAIGGALADGLEGKFNVSLADITSEKSDKPYDYYLKNLSKFDLIIGCVGKTILYKDQIDMLNPGTTLISLSSSDREFDIVDMRSQSVFHSSCHADFECPNGVKVMNCGFPINFSGEASKVDIEEFELTRALLTLGILQAIELSNTSGFVPLNTQVQMALVKQYSKKYKMAALRG